jgi:hypothetical protein
VLLVGVVMLVAPGPGLVVIAAGLSLLATEFGWARRSLKRARNSWTSLRARLRRPGVDQG